MNYLLEKILKKKTRLGDLNGLFFGTSSRIDDWFKVELTYTSNAIEGNTLSRAETAMVLEKGIAVQGKTLKEHLEAVNHGEAYEWLKSQVIGINRHLTQEVILHLHKLILEKIDDSNAGRYRTVPVRIAGSTVIMPNAAKVPELMNKFINWIQEKDKDPVSQAIEAHFRFVSIHPFVDGNGRTARLLMNFLLLKSGFPPAIIQKEDRLRYINSIEKGQLGGSLADYYQIMYEAVDRSLEICLEAQGKQEKSELIREKSVLKIGQLAKVTGESVPTIRHWTNEGLLVVECYSPGGYQLYSQEMVDKVYRIRNLQKERRLTLAEIKREIT